MGRKRGRNLSPVHSTEEGTRLQNGRRHKRRVKAIDSQKRIPREFSQLLAYAKGVKPPSGLDNGNESQLIKQRPEESSDEKSHKPSDGNKSDFPIIHPGERLIDFSARVDAALPVAGLVRKGKCQDTLGARKPQSKLQRRTKRMQDEWREKDAKLKARREEEAQELEDKLDELLPGVGARLAMWGSSSKNDDPWEDFAKAKRQNSQPSYGLRGLHDVVEAPPTLKGPRPKLKTKGEQYNSHGHQKAGRK